MTVNDIDTAFHVVGGPGDDSLVASGFDFAADQRNALFAASSIETIVDSTGSYMAPPADPSVAYLTTGVDTIIAPDGGSTAVATSVTLNSGDSLTGGAGTDVLMLQGGGWFRLDQLAHFSGFEQIKVDNVTSTAAELFLAGDQPITVSSSGSGRVEVQSVEWRDDNQWRSI